MANSGDMNSLQNPLTFHKYFPNDSGLFISPCNPFLSLPRRRISFIFPRTVLFPQLIVTVCWLVRYEGVLRSVIY